MARNSAASRQVEMPPMPGDPHAAAFRVARQIADHAQRDRLDRRAAIAAMGALAIDQRQRRHRVEVDADHGGQRVDQRHGIGVALARRAGRVADVGDVRCELDDDRHPGVLLAPGRDHLDIIRHLADRRAHAALRHAVGAAEIELDPVGSGVLDIGQDGLPAVLVARHHQGDDQRPVRPFPLDLLDLAQIDLDRPVRNQLDVGEAGHPGAVVLHRAVARRGVDDRLADGLPDDSAPACPEGAFDIVVFVRRRGGSQPKRVGRFDPDKVGSQVGHDLCLPLIVSGSGGSTARRPCRLPPPARSGRDRRCSHRRRTRPAATS